MSRRDELLKIIGNDPRNEKMIDYVLGLEERIDQLDANDKNGVAPFYCTNPNNPQQQRVNPTFKAYKELLQQYTNCYKALFKGEEQSENKDDSPLRKWAAKRNVDTN